jgi:predicted phage terminase large subunit-like protein
LNTYEFTLDEIVEISEAGIEDVFDIQVDRTENFIANGLVSHNTRWHENDLAGRLISLAKSDPNADQWEVVSFPAIKESDINLDDPRELGMALWPGKYNIDRLQKIKASVGSRVWNALYQQRPSATEGNIVKREWLRFYTSLPERMDEWIISVDATFTGKATSDFVAMQVWARKGSQKFLIDQTHRRMGITDTIRALTELIRKYPHAALKLIENKANGPAIEDLLKTQISGLVLWEPKGDKVSRMNAVTPQFEAGNVLFPLSSLNPWVQELIDEIVTFPNSAHDDRSDALTMALIRLDSSVTNEVGFIRILR